MRYYRLYANQSTTQANAANVVMVRAGRIRSVRWSNRYDSVTDNSYVECELSNQPTSVASQNDSRGPIDQCAWEANGATPVGHVNQQIAVDFPIASGERLYLNVTAGGTVDAKLTCIVGVEE